jgi:hypothetical protein
MIQREHRHRVLVEKAEAVVEAAENEPEEFGYLVDQMDRSGKVAGAFRRLEVLKQARQLEIAAPEFPAGPFQVIVADPPWRYESGNDLPTRDSRQAGFHKWKPHFCAGGGAPGAFPQAGGILHARRGHLPRVCSQNPV